MMSAYPRMTHDSLENLQHREFCYTLSERVSVRDREREFAVCEEFHTNHSKHREAEKPTVTQCEV